MVRAAIYTRISNDRTGAGLGVATQEADCRELAARDPEVTVTRVYTDNDLSAYSGKPRPQYQRLLDAMRSGEVDAVLCWHTDRLHRSPVELEEYVAIAETRDIATRTVKAGHLDLASPSGRLVARQLGAVARYEVEHAVERMRRAKQRSAEAGKWRGGRRPYGFEADGVTVRPEEAEAVAEGTSVILAGRSLRQVAREWNDLGRRTTSGNPWEQHTLRIMLKRPRNAGLIEQRGKIIGKAEWPAIVSEDEWQALVDLLANPARRTNLGGSARRWLGSGLYKCECGSAVICSSSNGSTAYRCRGGCGQMSRRQEPVDDLLRAAIVDRLRSPNAADLLPIRDAGELAAREAEATRLRDKLDNLGTMHGNDEIDDRQFAESSKITRARLAAVRAEIAECYQGTALAPFADAEDPGAAWLAAPLDQQRAVVDALCSVTLLRGAAGRPSGWKPGNPYFRPDLVRIEWRQPDRL